MTIAACYLSPEGVVFGADSTTTVCSQKGLRHYNYAQKIFEIGEPSTLGIVTWGMGGLPSRSHRTLIAQFADVLRGGPQLATVGEVAQKWGEHFWAVYAADLAPELARAADLHMKAQRNKADEDEYESLLHGLSGGFCVGGNLLHAREPQAFEFTYSPIMTGPVVPKPLQVGATEFYGCPNLVNRLMYGADFAFLDRLLTSGHWQGTPDELRKLLEPSMLHPMSILPIREAIDWVHASIYTTIKTMKFSQLAQVCGGPVEVAVITADRCFRWVRHKRLGSAIEAGEVTHV